MHEPAAPRAKSTLLWPLHIDASLRDGVRVVSARGRLGVEGSPVLKAALASEVEAGNGQILLDLAGVDYVSSAGLRVLSDAAGSARLSGFRLVLCGLTEPVRLAVELAGIGAELEIEATIEAGLARFAS